ncbi:hypothetical protein [Capnocytophaga canimorsus]|uniref:hypothetical protein n=1 Tax=Capnocytophaga canimorsus TaxID=28188 RepID=UPI001EE11425|nr:hypothetical protein [Capnocytophaga canimorsus]GJQ04451.1 hypothetical protein CAPN009_08660 [Capnocytophaga canimorsus]
MEEKLFLLLLYLLPLLAVLVLIGITYFLYDYLSKKYPNKYYKYFAFIPIVLLGYWVYSSIFPDSDFYKADYKEVTQLNFPKEAKFIYKDATFPDHFGDYTSVFLFETTPEAFKELENQLSVLEFNQVQDSVFLAANIIAPALNRTNRNLTKQYVSGETDKRFYIGLFDDAKTILICRESW